MNQLKTICYFGDFDPEYPRNRVLIKGLMENNVAVELCQTTAKGLKKIKSLYKQHKLLKNKYDLMIVGYSDSRLILPLAKVISNKKVIWDAFYSIYDSWIFDRQLSSPFSIKAIYYWLLDWLNCSLASKILLDTNAHIEYFTKTFKQTHGKFIKVLVGSDSEVFTPVTQSLQTENFLVHFHGKFIPLQGVEYLIKAAGILSNHQDIKFNIIGSGQDFEKNVKLADKLGLTNINFIKKVEYKKLPELMSKASVCLGIFGASNKAKNVIPNKVYEATAMGKPIITARTPAIQELFTDHQDILLCQPADPADLANKILELKNNIELRQLLSQNILAVFNRLATPKILVEKLLKELDKVLY